MSSLKECRQCDKALEINPNLDYVYVNKGDALSSLNKYEEAIKCYDKALETNPNLDYVYVNKGYALSSLNKY